MKRIGYIYEKVADIDNILLAINKASKGKRKYAHVKQVLKNKFEYAEKIRTLLLSGNYKPPKMENDNIIGNCDKKHRKISKCKFYPEQIIQWAIVLQLSPIICKTSYKYSCGSMPNRGIDFAKRYLQPKIQNKFKATKYYLKTDITKFFPSVDNKVMINFLHTKFKDKRFLKLLEDFINLEKGLPIGTLLSQWLSNYYLQRLDYFIKQNLKIKIYCRYVDDMILFSHSKKKLHKTRRLMQAFCKDILKLNITWQCVRTDFGLDFVGFRFFRNVTILRKRIMLRMSKKVKRVHKKGTWTPSNCMAIISYLGRTKKCKCFKFYQNYIKPYINLRKMKKIISEYCKGVNNANLHIKVNNYS